MWVQKQIESHISASKKLVQIKDKLLELLKNNKSINEKQASDFILKRFNELGLETDKDIPIVAFGKNTDRPHYFPESNSKNLEEGDIIIMDLWAKEKGENNPFADITHMAINSKRVSKQVEEVFNVVIKARDECVLFLERELKKGRVPTGKEVDSIARDLISSAGYGAYFLHSTGHCLGNISVHGPDNNLNQKDESKLLVNMGYTIEPGIYLKDDFGIRSEIDFYINEKLNLILTTPLQKEINKL